MQSQSLEWLTVLPCLRFFTFSVLFMNHFSFPAFSFLHSRFPFLVLSFSHALSYRMFLIHIFILIHTYYIYMHRYSFFRSYSSASMDNISFLREDSRFMRISSGKLAPLEFTWKRLLLLRLFKSTHSYNDLKIRYIILILLLLYMYIK